MLKNFLLLLLAFSLVSCSLRITDGGGDQLSYPAGARGWMYYWKPKKVKADSGEGKIKLDVTAFADVFFTKFNDTIALGITFVSDESARAATRIPQLKVNGRPVQAIKAERLPTTYERWRYTYVKGDTLSYFENKKALIELFDSTASYRTTLKYRH
ncbi:MAG: hypothetical protein EP332_08315 [Bacteroidetes bacterium]|nr:MAG: hypothetical protein EP332_08315 [Bacteroidota bacterium]